MKIPIRIICIIISALSSVHAQNISTSPLDPVRSRELILQWVQTERIISEEKTTWLAERQRMHDLLEIYKTELALLSEELEAVGGAAELIDSNKEKLEKDLAHYREANRILRSSMARLLPRMQTLAERFPLPLKDELRTDINFINMKQALDVPRDVLKSIIAILNAAGNFNRAITLAEETRSFADGKKMNVKVLYLGLCCAYYAADQGPLAGIGQPSPQGAWVWSKNEAIADQVRKTIAVYRKSKQPQIVELPVQLQQVNKKGGQ